MNLAVRSIEWLEEDRCRVVFQNETTLLESSFTVQRTPVGPIANPDPNVFMDLDGNAEDVRAVVGLVVAFCDAAQIE